MNIRFLDTEDAVAYRALRKFSLEESPFAFSDSEEEEGGKSLEESQSEIMQTGSPLEAFALGAFTEASELIGFVKFKRDPRKKARHRAGLYALYVAPAHRGNGVAKQLVNRLAEIAASIPGLEQIQLWALVSETSVVPFYESAGFRKNGGIIEKDLIINDIYVDAVCMVKYPKDEQ